MKSFYCVLLAFVSVIFFGCANTYGLKENWIDDDDLKKIQIGADIYNILPSLGTPVFTEMHGDTLELLYNYRAHLYESEKDSREYKPNDKNRTSLWSNKTEVAGLLVVNHKIVGVRYRGDFPSDNQNLKVESLSLTKLLGVLGVAGLTLVVVLLILD